MCYSASGASYEVRLGITRLDASEPGSVIVTSRISIIHSAYNVANLENDIAVIELPSAIVSNGENCHILVNIKLIFLIHEPPQLLPALLTAQNFIGL
jgi:secreted trypsin-like serine protease